MFLFNQFINHSTLPPYNTFTVVCVLVLLYELF